MIQEKRQLCKACATGNEKLEHNGDIRTCIKGREGLIELMPSEQQIRHLIVHERLSLEMAKYIQELATERKKTPLEIIKDEGLNLFEEK